MSPKQEHASIWSDALAGARELDRDADSPEQVLTHLSDAADTLIRTLVVEAIETYGKRYAGASDPFAVVAVGGYGRRQLHPHSDIDLLFIYPWKPTPLIESIAEHILYALWDLGMKVGHATRSLAQCIQIGREDTTVRTNILDHRLIDGDASFYDEAVTKLDSDLLRHRISWFADQKVTELENRRARFSDTAYVLEPNIKESPGGLRDVHTAYWISKTAFRVEKFGELFPLGILDRSEADVLDSNFARLLEIRNRLHFVTNKPTDQLTMAAQGRIAPLYGFSDSKEELATEQFMRQFYETARETKQTVDIAIEVFGDRLNPPSRAAWFRRKRALGDGFYRYRDQIYGAANQLENNPALLVRAFNLRQQEQLPLSFELKKTLRTISAATDWESFSEQAAADAGALFCELVVDGRDLFEILLEMNEIGVLRTIIPEFEHQYCRVQHDTYHIYTADVHLLVCMRIYSELTRRSLDEEDIGIQEVFDRIADPLVTGIAVLLHDIGKGYGGDHSVIGAEMCTTICKRLGMKQSQARTVSFLVREHLTLSHTAQRRDLSDHRVIRDFANKMPDVETLDALLCLTYCDQNGVGPGVWTPWKRSLMVQLHEDAKRELEREDIQGVYRDRIRHRRNRGRKTLLDTFDASVLDPLLEALPPRFFIRNNDEMLSEVVRLYAERDSAPYGIAVVPDNNFGAKVILAQPNHVGVFAFHAGLFALADQTIMSAEGYALPKLDWVTNIFSVNALDPIFFTQPERVTRFRRKAISWMSSPEATSRKIDKRLRELEPVTQRSRRRARVRVDQELSQNYTVFEVYGWDRIGLLHQLSNVFTHAGCDIWLARIDTEGQRVSDTFYIKTVDGKQLQDEAKVAEIIAALYDVVDEKHIS